MHERDSAPVTPGGGVSLHAALAVYLLFSPSACLSFVNTSVFS